ATSRQPRFRYAALVRRATLALLAGRLEEASQLIGQAEILGEECGEPGVRDVRYDQGWDLLTAQGRLGELAGTLPEMFPDPESTQARGARAQVLIAAGARDEAAEVVAPLLDRGPEVMPANHQRLIGLAYARPISRWWLAGITSGPRSSSGATTSAASSLAPAAISTWARAPRACVDSGSGNISGNVPASSLSRPCAVSRSQPWS